MTGLRTLVYKKRSWVQYYPVHARRRAIMYLIIFIILIIMKDFIRPSVLHKNNQPPEIK
jgi:hypothetical protein